MCVEKQGRNFVEQNFEISTKLLDAILSNCKTTSDYGSYRRTLTDPDAPYRPHSKLKEFTDEELKEFYNASDTLNQV